MAGEPDNETELAAQEIARAFADDEKKFSPVRYYLRFAIFGILATVAGVGLAFALYTDRLSFFPDVGKYLVFFGYLFGCAFFLLRLTSHRPSMKGVRTEAQLEAAGMIVRENYCVKRAMKVEQFEDEGLHFLLELDDGRLLYLTGQYLWYFDEEDNDPSFPSTTFMLKRLKGGGVISSLLPTGVYVEPIEVFADNHTSIFYEKWDVGDGAILPFTFDQAREQLQAWKK